MHALQACVRTHWSFDEHRIRNCPPRCRRRPRRRRSRRGPATSSCKANVHRKLLNRLNLEALAQRRPRARRKRDPHARQRAARRRKHADQPGRARRAVRRAARRRVRPRAARAAAARPDDQRHPGQHLQARVRRARRRPREGVDATFQDDRHLLRVIDRIVSGVGRRIDDSSPMVDARLPDGSRVNAIIPPLAVDGPLLSIRRFPAERLKADDLVSSRR